MNNVWDDVRAAVDAGKEARRAVNAHAKSMAQLLVGQMRTIEDVYTLRALKRELRQFDMVTGRWRRP